MTGIRYLGAGRVEALDSLGAVVRDLDLQRPALAALPADEIVEGLDRLSARLLEDPRTRAREGVAFLAAWLRRPSLERLLELNLGGRIEALDGFVPSRSGFLAVRPRGLVAMWMAGNVPTLPLFSIVPALLGKNVCLVKLASPDPDFLPAVLDLLPPPLRHAIEVVWFESADTALSAELSRAADAKVVWGGAAAIAAIRALPQADHCVNVEMGPKYSIAVLGRRRLEVEDGLDGVLLALARDVAAFDQRACSSPQTVFMERNARLSRRDVGERIARALAALPPKAPDDPWTTLRIVEARAEWAMDEERDVIASPRGTEFSVLMDGDVALKEAVQSRTVFLVEVGSWGEVIPLLSQKVQTIGASLLDPVEDRAFADAALTRGVARVVRPGLMNVHESPWDGKLLLSELVRWVTWKP